MTSADDRARIYAAYPTVCRRKPYFNIVAKWVPILELALRQLEAIAVTQTKRGENPVTVIAVYEKYRSLRIDADSLSPDVEAILLAAEEASEMSAGG